MEIIVAVSAVITAIATGVMIWAVYVAPTKAFEAQWQLQLRNAARERRVQLFRTLMATRGNAIDSRHVEALNMIDVEFAEASERDIRDAWQTYLNHLTQMTEDSNEPDDGKRLGLQDRNEEKRKDLLAELLQRMGTHLGYDFSFTYLKGRVYYPQGHGQLAEEQAELRKGLLQMLWKGRPLIVRVIEPPPPTPGEKANTKAT